MQTVIPYICEGEIYQVMKHVGVSRKPIRYICKVSMPDGSTILVTNCTQSTMFGGVDDYVQFRSRSSEDSKGNIETSNTDELNAAQIGDRVYIAFVGGNILKPVIIGYAQHPNQTYEFANDKPEDIDPSLVFKYLGIKATIDDEGQLRLIHRGAPEIKYVPRPPGTGLLASASSLLASGPGSDLPNPAVTPQDAEETTLFEFLNGGVFRLRDAEGQIIEIDRTKKRIYISNNDLKSTQSEDGIGVVGNQLSSNSTDAEYVLLDKDKELVLINARKTAQIYSFDKRKDVTEGKHTHNVGENSEWTIQGDEKEDIYGDQVTTIDGDQKVDINGNKEEEVGGDWSIDVDGDVEINASGGAFFTMKKGKVTFGGNAAELLDLFDKTLKQLDTLLTAMESETHPTSIGPSGPPLNSAQYVQVQSALKQIDALLGQIKG